jgi:hypothetical protein
MDEDRADAGYRTLWTICLVAGVASLVLITLYYWRHPQRHVLTDFAPRPVSDEATPGPPPDTGLSTDSGVPPGSEGGEP